MSIGWAIVVLGLSVIPGISLPSTWIDIIAPDKLAHMIVYGLFSFLLMYEAVDSGHQKQKTLILAIFISSIWGILMEAIQYSFFPDRYFEILDIIANIIGSIIGAFIYKRFFN